MCETRQPTDDDFTRRRSGSAAAILKLDGFARSNRSLHEWPKPAPRRGTCGNARGCARVRKPRSGRAEVHNRPKDTPTRSDAATVASTFEEFRKPSEHGAWSNPVRPAAALR